MMIKKLHLAALAGLVFCAASTKAQLTITSGTTFMIQSGASVTVQGDIVSNADISGPGKVVLKGSANQNVNMNGFTVPNLEMDNTAGATLTGNAKFGTNVTFTNGKIALGNNTATLVSGATVTTPGTGKFFETNGTGFLRRELAADLASTVMPVGSGTNYTPISIANTGSTYASASIGVQAKGVAEPNKHPRTESFLTTYWPISKTGITGGTLTGVGTYVDGQITGTEADLVGLYWDGTNWSNTGSNQNAASNTAGATATAATGNLYAMNKFLLSRLRVMLQGPFNTSTLVMSDNLRLASPTVLIPTSDPYRLPEYSAAFPHTANATAETVSATVFNNAALTDNDIVDWVFIELRQGTSPGNTLLQTRSALIQRDGDIVDIDGVSPLYFKNLDPNTNYSFGVRHRNHLGIYTSTVAPGNLYSLGLAAGSMVDISTLAAGSLHGTAGTNYDFVSGRNLMYAGNTNVNTNVKWAAPSSDKDFILSNVLAGNPGTVLNNVYSQGDVNLNRGVKWAAPNSDKDFILANPLGSSSANVRTQIIPN